MLKIFTKRKIITWNYRKCFKNLYPIWAILAFLVLLGFVGTMEYNDKVQSQQNEVQRQEIQISK